MKPRFEVFWQKCGSTDQWNICDHEQEVLTIYNDLGSCYFSSAPQVCKLLNELDNEVKHYKESLKECQRELYCKDRKLEELGVSIEVCDEEEE